MTPRQAAEAWGVTQASIYTWAKFGRIPYFTDAEGHMQIPITATRPIPKKRGRKAQEPPEEVQE